MPHDVSDSSDERQPVWAIDIGGTKIQVVVGFSDGSLIASERFALDKSQTPEAVLKQAIAELTQLSAAHEHTPAAIGVACPGPFDRREQQFLATPNLPQWQGFRIGDFMRDQIGGSGAGLGGTPCFFMNDANAAALAEWLWGAGRGHESLVYLTLSTGFGAGLVLEGRVYEGIRGFAGEVGRIQLADDGPIGFGAAGTAEGFLSGPGIEQMAEAEALACRQRGEQTGLHECGLHELTPRVSCAQVCELAASGDAAAGRVIHRSAVRLGQFMAIAANILEPEVFALGTIGEAHPDLFIPAAVSELNRLGVPEITRHVQVLPSKLGPDRAAKAALAVAAHNLSGAAK